MSESNSETIEFNADINQLMNLIINAFYSKNEIFLRELLSNSSDALEKIRYESLTDKSVLDSTSDLKIQVSVDKENKTLMIEDTGIGMTRVDLIENLGTIARSGTKSFMEKLKDASKDVDQIGQFGVGFYSSFLVADNVTVYTKHNSDKEYIWESNSDKSYTISENTTPSLSRGTRMILKLKESQEEYLDINTIKETIKKYTQFINFPIELLETKTIEVDEEKNDDADADESDEDKNTRCNEEDEPAIEELDEATEDSKDSTPKKVQKQVDEWTVINHVKPIWTKKPEDVTQDEYNNFYKSFTKEYMDPVAYKHFNTEGQLELNSILYLPDSNGMNMFQQNNDVKNEIKLYVRKVFIKDNCEGLLPTWLNFMKGIVDSNDIPLNVSRELLQQNKIIKSISKVLVKKSIELFNEIAEDDEKYKKFYDLYSKMLKLGVHEDTVNRDKLTKLLRYYSLNSSENFISLDNYLENMQETQTTIYYITGQSREAISNSPFIEKCKKRGEDVLYFTDPIDEYMVNSVGEYSGKKLVDLSKEGLLLDEEATKKRTEEYKEFIDFFKNKLGSKVNDVKITDRLDSVPCMLSSAQFGWTANMERIMKAQALRNDSMDQFMGAKKILELNLDHRIIKMVYRKYKDDEESEKLGRLLNLLYETAILSSGFNLDTPTQYAKKVNNLIEVGFCDDVDELDDHDDTCQEVDSDNKEDTEKSEPEREMEMVD